MKVWFITGASRGLGKQWAIAALERGDRIAIGARDIAALSELSESDGEAVLPIRLDVTDRDACFAAVQAAHDYFGRIDMVVNNAATGQYGFVEELSESEARHQMDTNFIGALWVTQAALPILRAQGGGRILQVSSIGGVTALPNLGSYHASKWAPEGLTQSLAGEVGEFGIHVTLVEPGGFATDWVGAATLSAPLEAYGAQRETFETARRERMSDLAPPEASRPAILEIVDADKPPLRVFLGENVFALARADYQSRLAEWEQWEAVARSAHGRSVQVKPPVGVDVHELGEVLVAACGQIHIGNRDAGSPTGFGVHPAVGIDDHGGFGPLLPTFDASPVAHCDRHPVGAGRRHRGDDFALPLAFRVWKPRPIHRCHNQFRTLHGYQPGDLGELQVVAHQHSQQSVCGRQHCGKAVPWGEDQLLPVPQVGLAVDGDHFGPVDHQCAVVQAAVGTGLAEPADHRRVPGRVDPAPESRAIGGQCRGAGFVGVGEHVARRHEFGKHHDLGAVGHRICDRGRRSVQVRLEVPENGGQLDACDASHGAIPARCPSPASASGSRG